MKTTIAWVDRCAAIAATTALTFGLSALPSLAFQQSPVLDALVAAGTLPAVDERLPAEPLVVDPVESIGKYGGTWRSGLNGGKDIAWIVRTTGYDGLFRYDRQWRSLVPNLASGYEVDETGRAYTITLRSGLKWSNGEPFSAEDIAYAVELLNNSIYPRTVAGWMNDPANPVVVEVVDPVTIRFTFEKPNGMFIDDLANVNGGHVVGISKAYCSQFDPAYNPEAEALATENGFDSAGGYLFDRCSFLYDGPKYANVDLPTMNGWKMVEPLNGSATRVVLERNPYYFKVDTEGNQLPYIDRVEMRVSESVEQLTLAALNGEIDFQDRHINNVPNTPVFYDGMEKGGYIMGREDSALMNTMLIMLNLNHSDPVLRDLFNNKDFRIGFSHSIDRQEIIDVVFAGLGEPWQAAPRPESNLYNETMAKQYTELDPVKAAEHFAAAGLTEKNADGLWILSDGRPLSFDMDTVAAFKPEWGDMLELMRAQLLKAGIDMRINTLDRALFDERRPANDFDAQVWEGQGGLDVMQSPIYYMPFSNSSSYAFKWAAYYSGQFPDIAEEPPAWVLKQIELYRELRSEPSEERRLELMAEVLKIAQEEFPLMGIGLPPPGYFIAQTNLKNVPAVLTQAFLFPTPGPYDPAQWYFE